jgi:hypothetical protein
MNGEVRERRTERGGQRPDWLSARTILHPRPFILAVLHQQSDSVQPRLPCRSLQAKADPTKKVAALPAMAAAAQAAQTRIKPEFRPKSGRIQTEIKAIKPFLTLFNPKINRHTNQ